MSIMQAVNASASPEVQMNENFETLEAMAVYGKRQPVTTGLTWGYYGGLWNGNTVTEGTLTLTSASANYIVVNRSTGAISTATTNTNWLDTAYYARVYKVTTTGGVVTAVEDHRVGGGGVMTSSDAVYLVSGGGGPSNAYYFSHTDVIAASTHTLGIKALAASPTEATERILSASVTNSTSLLSTFEDGVLDVSAIPAGVWAFSCYAYVSSATNSSNVVHSQYYQRVGSGTLTITGTGASRTATVVGGTPFVAGDVNASNASSAWIRTPTAQLRITAYTSTSVVTVECLTGYTNEAGVAYSKDTLLFEHATPDIDALSVANTDEESTHGLLTIQNTDKLVIRIWARTDAVSARTIYFYYGGIQNYSHMHTPLRGKHNDLPGIQGGSVAEYYHLTATEQTEVKLSAGTLGGGAGAGGSVTQITSRTTGVTLDKVCGAITLVSAVGSTSWQTFTVTNAAVVATDCLILVQKSGADLYELHITAVAAGSFDITYRTTGGATTEQPVLNFALIRALAS